MVVRYNTEAEYKSLAQETVDLLWIQTLLNELYVTTKTPAILCDNQYAVLLAHNPIMYRRAKHTKINMFFMREKVIAKQLDVIHIPGTYHLADVLTKPFASTKFLELEHKLIVANSP